MHDGIRRLLLEVVRIDFRRLAQGSRSEEFPSDAVVHFTVDSILSVYTWWRKHSPDRTPAEIDAIFRRLALPSLKASGFLPE